jgi:hypothetical protein
VNKSGKPRYPIFVISKGRAAIGRTARILKRNNTPFYLVVEPKEYDEYGKYHEKKLLLKSPKNFSEEGKGSIPVRNFVWEKSIEMGYKKHWVVDDNIREIYWFNNNLRQPVWSSVPFIVAEDFTDRYTNIGLSGLNYANFAIPYSTNIHFNLNTRIYSCILVDNTLPFRWRGRYNEDTDLSLRVLKHGLCTVLLNVFVIEKSATLKMRGGNTDTIYNTGDERKEFAESLQKQHPDLVKVVRRFERWHHEVDYSVFKLRNLIRDPKVKIGMDKINNYGLTRVLMG